MSDWINRVHFGDCLETLRRMPDGIVNTCVTSPPYFGLRDYGHAGQIGLEETPEQFIAKLVEVFREVRRVLRDDGTAWVNMGDSYAGGGGGNYNKTGKTQAGGQHVTNVRNRPEWLEGAGLKAKDLIGVPWMLAFALRADGWYLRSEIIWHKPNPMPESVTDRPTKAHEQIFLLSKSATYHCDMEAIKEPAKDWSTGGPGVGIENTAERYGAGNGGNDGLASLAARYRSKRDSFKRDDSKRAEVIPGQTVGTHRDDREESDYDLTTRNRRSVWTVATKPYKGAHFATYPTELIEPCILAGAPVGGVVLDPFFGSGTTGEVAQNLGRNWIGCELNPAYKELQDERLQQPGFQFVTEAA